MTRYQIVISITNIDSGKNVEIIPNRWNSNRIKLIRINIGETGFSKRACFYASGKDYLIFRDAVPFCSSSVVGNTKKIIIRLNELVYLYSNQDKADGIAVFAKRF